MPPGSHFCFSIKIRYCFGRKAVRSLVGSVMLLVGAPITVSAQVCDEPASNSGEVTYAYDVLGRLIQVCHDNGQNVSYTYDSVGNRTTVLAIEASPKAEVIVVPLSSGFFIIPQTE